MSRLTGNEVANMMEAYSAVYAPQQEEVVENVEKIDEKMDVFSTPAMKSAQQQSATQLLTGKKPPAKPDYLKPAVTAGAAKFFTKPGAETDKSWEVARQKAGVSKPTRPAGSGNPPAGSGNPPAGSGNPPAGTKTAPAASSVVLAKQGGVEGKLDKATGKFTAGAFTGAEKERYVARGGSAAPSAPKPAAPAQPKIKQDVADIKAMQTASQMRQAGANVTSDQLKTPPSTAVNTSQATAAASNLKAPDPATKFSQGTAATPKPVENKPTTGFDLAKKGVNLQSQSFDIFDIIKGHLLDEGYAETEKAALAIMANMGEGWKKEILDEIAPALLAGGVLASGALAAMAAKNKIDRSNAARANTNPFANQQTKPLPSTPSPFAKPASKDDSGRLTTYGAGGGAAAEKTGQTRAQVMQQGGKNLENKNKIKPVNQGTDFGR
jgi:hypothetical protein